MSAAVGYLPLPVVPIEPCPVLGLVVPFGEVRIHVDQASVRHRDVERLGRVVRVSSPVEVHRLDVVSAFILDHHFQPVELVEVQAIGSDVNGSGITYSRLRDVVPIHLAPCSVVEIASDGDAGTTALVVSAAVGDVPNPRGIVNPLRLIARVVYVVEVDQHVDLAGVRHRDVDELGRCGARSCEVVPSLGIYGVVILPDLQRD